MVSVTTDGLCQAKKSLPTCVKCADSDQPVYAQSMIWASVRHSNILVYPMILLWDCEGPDQTVDVQADLGLRCRVMPNDTFSHGLAQRFLRHVIKTSTSNTH